MPSHGHPHHLLVQIHLGSLCCWQELQHNLNMLRIPFQNHQLLHPSLHTHVGRLQILVSALASSILYSNIYTQNAVLDRKNVSTLGSLINSAKHQRMIGPTCNFLTNGPNKNRLTIITLYPGRVYDAFSSASKIYKQPAISIDTGTLTTSGIEKGRVCGKEATMTIRDFTQAELAAIAAAILRGHPHITTDSLPSPHQIRKQILYPELTSSRPDAVLVGPMKRVPRTNCRYPLRSTGGRGSTQCQPQPLHLLPRSVTLASSFQNRGTSILWRSNTVKTPGQKPARGLQAAAPRSMSPSFKASAQVTLFKSLVLTLFQPSSLL
eukprot:1144501-Pelagomonas_calceolata.AAC.4